RCGCPAEVLLGLVVLRRKIGRHAIILRAVVSRGPPWSQGGIRLELTARLAILEGRIKRQDSIALPSTFTAVWSVAFLLLWKAAHKRRRRTTIGSCGFDDGFLSRLRTRCAKMASQ